jgi:hypothetical protein
MRIVQWMDTLLERARVRFLCAGLLTVSAVLLVISFATADQRRTIFGPPLGADFAGFYTAGQILNQPTPQERERLYDSAYQDTLYHQLLPRVQEDEKLPYVHPPFVAVAFRFLAQMPYEWAFTCWLLITAVLYVGGLLLIRQAFPEARTLDYPTVLLLALSFEAFLMECWLGGQLSAFGFICVASALACDRLDLPFAAGLLLGFCLYKPTLLVLLLPMLFVARQWRMIAGFTLTAFALIGVSLRGTGQKNTLDYVQALFGFTQTATGGSSSFGTLELRLWKYVDLNSFLKLLLGTDSSYVRILLGLAAVAALPFLVRLWWRFDRRNPAGRSLIWSTTLTWTLVLNLYVGVYDSILVVLPALLWAVWLFQRGGVLTPTFRFLLLLLYLIPWITQPIARGLGLQLDTLILLAFGIYQLRASTRTLVG